MAVVGCAEAVESRQDVLCKGSLADRSDEAIKAASTRDEADVCIVEKKCS